MAKRNVPLGRSGRIRGHGVSPATPRARSVLEAMKHPSRRGEKPTPQGAVRSAQARLERESIRVKPTSIGAEGRLPLASPSTRRANLRNAKRKPEARRGRARKRALRG